MGNLNKYYVEDYYNEPQFTAGVVRQDNEVLLRLEGYKPINFTITKNYFGFGKIARLLQAVWIAIKCNKESEVIFHFPMHAGIYKLLQWMLHFRGIKTIAFIIDIDGIRDNDAALLQNEIIQLKRFDFIIAHNEAMKNTLQQLLPFAKIFCIQLFDYPFKGEIANRILSPTICIAANFSKSTFVTQLFQLKALTFNLYGQHYIPAEVNKSANIFYHGVITPTDLPYMIQGSFGLVWDGDKIESCDNYLRINNPHKLSLYLAAGIPVIVWEESAVATFVEENKLGITINTLLEMNEKISQLTSIEYNTLQKNALKMSAKITQGFYLKNVLATIHNNYFNLIS